jgi:serralysin
MATQERIADSGYGDPYVDSLVTGFVWRSANPGPTVIRVAFAEGDFRPGNGPGAGDAWTSAERTAFYKAMATYESIINVDFQEMGDYSRADILWYSVDDSVLKGTTLADHSLPDGSQSQQFGNFRWDVDEWNYLRPGQSGFLTIIHEIGHGLGLDHPHPDRVPLPGFMPFPGVSSAGDLGDNEFNQNLYTIMSYNDGWDDAADTLQYGQAMTPMAFDIAALQVMYGANMSYRTGNDTYHIGVDYDSPATGWTCI